MIRVKVSARGLHGEFERKLKQYASAISTEMVGEIAEQAKNYAQKLYNDAEYAGQEHNEIVKVDVHTSGPLSREIVVDDNGTGIATYIEYGTGIYASKGHANGLRLTPRKHTKKGRWFFYDDERDKTHGPISVEENDYVEPADKREIRVKTEVYDAFGKPTGEFEYQGETEIDYRFGVWTTKGNPAHNIMTKTREYILSEALPGVARNTPGVKLTKW